MRNMLKALSVALCFVFLGMNVLAEGSATAMSADEMIVSVQSYGFVDLEGAKVSAIIVEYSTEIDGTSVDDTTYAISDYTTLLAEEQGFDTAIEMDYDGMPGNEGQITGVYVNDHPATSEIGVDSGRYVIIEVNTDYMLSGQNLVYTQTMIAGATQLKPILTADGNTIEAGTHEIRNYTESEQAMSRGGNTGGQGNGGQKAGRNGQRPGGGQMGGGTRVSRTADTDKIILPEFDEGNGWTLHYIGDDAFKATNCYSEYTGQYEDFELPYSLYVPPQEIMEANRGNIGMVIHMEHAGGNDTDPMSAITSSRAAVKLASAEVQNEHPSIIVVPQVEESRRSTDDLVASSEVNTAAWELLDWLMEEYAEYIDPNRVYGTGQSMGGMTILNMASQRDNFFAGIAVVGAQWSNNYDKDYQHNGSPARTPENDPISFAGDGVDAENFANWYYMISDDNILVQTCLDDGMATGEWRYTKEYLEMAGGSVAYAEWDPYLEIAEQNAQGKALVNRDTSAPGTGISWVVFTKGSHMSTWKYGYRLDFAFDWLFQQTRQSEMERGKLEQLKEPWLGRDASGAILPGSGTAGLNSAQFTVSGTSDVFTEGWTPESVETTND